MKRKDEQIDRQAENARSGGLTNALQWKKKPFSYHGSSHNAIIPYNKINSALNCNSNDCLSFFPLAICILKSINNL